jgi:hypothetical protein
MTRLQLEHIIRAAAVIADDTDIVVIGSQAILGQFPTAPAELLVSREADVFPQNFPDRSDMIDGSIGDGSPFERTYGYFAHGVAEETAILAPGWRERLIEVSNPNTLPGRGWCLEVHDLALAKYVAGREKDMAFNAALARHRMVDPEVLYSRRPLLPISEALHQIVAARIASHFPRS